jgi:hypothetical protein
MLNANCRSVGLCKITRDLQVCTRGTVLDDVQNLIKAIETTNFLEN